MNLKLAHFGNAHLERLIRDAIAVLRKRGASELAREIATSELEEMNIEHTYARTPGGAAQNIVPITPEAA